MSLSELKKLNIPPVVRQEIEDFASEVERLFQGDMDVEDFKRFRLQQGIYGQRQNDEQMVRTKLPFGRCTSDQVRCLADFADAYSNGVLHVTTRQDIQFHFVKIKDVPEALMDLAKHGLTSREACGNTVRNVTACHKSGTCPDEAFDATPYAQMVTDYLIRHPLTQNLPRKFKISLGGCQGCGLAPIHDIGMNARVRDERRGFRLIIGGGLGSYPRSAELLSEFVPVEDLLQTCEAIIIVFDKHGDKGNRNKARFKFVVEKYGIEKTRELIEEAFAALSHKTYPTIETPEETVPDIPPFEPNHDFDQDPEFRAWVSRNTTQQRQKGFYNAHLKLLLGDLNSHQARAVATIAADYAGGYVINTVHQNIMIPWVPENGFGNVYAELKKIGLHKAGTEELKDMTSCPGSETCNLGITHSRGLIDELSGDVDNDYTQSGDLDHINIKASGCPNSCGQHHIAAIGFSGSARKVNGILTPHYEVMLGGRITEDHAQFGQTVAKIPSKNAPNAVRLLIARYRAERKNGETFNQYYDRMGKNHFNEMLAGLKTLPDIETSPESYIDYHSTTKFTLDDRGQGECAGAISELISDHISEAERALFQGKKLMEKDETVDAARQAQRAFLCCARGMMHTEGIDLTDNQMTLQKFESLIVETGIVAELHSGIAKRCLENPQTLSPGRVREFLREADTLVRDCKEAYQKMKTQHTLRIRVDDANEEHEDGHTPTRETFFDVTQDRGDGAASQNDGLVGTPGKTS